MATGRPDVSLTEPVTRTTHAASADAGEPAHDGDVADDELLHPAIARAPIQANFSLFATPVGAPVGTDEAERDPRSRSGIQFAGRTVTFAEYVGIAKGGTLALLSAALMHASAG